MNSREREIFQTILKDEKDVLRALRTSYHEAMEAVEERIAALLGREPSPSVAYQVQFQEALHERLEEALGDLAGDGYVSIAQYLDSAYENGFWGVLYSLDGQGIDISVPFDPSDVIKIVNSTNDSIPLSSRLYSNVSRLTGDIRQEVSRGIAASLGYADIARNVSARAEIALRNAQRIAQTEGHRVSESAAFDAMLKAKERGADIVKQWDSALDARTRPTHAAIDGQIREIDEPFESEGHMAMHPGGFGIASEDINCRCVMLQRARWALDGDGETEDEQEEESLNFEQFKERQRAEARDAFAGARVAGLPKSGNPMEQFNEIAKRRWGAPYGNRGILDGNFAALSEDIRNEILVAIDEQIMANSSLHGKLHSVALDRLGGNVFYAVAKTPDGIELRINSLFATNPKAILESIDEAIAKGFLVSGPVSGAYGIPHETGHCLEALLKTVEEWKAKPSSNDAASQIVKEAFEELGYKVQWDKDFGTIRLKGDKSFRQTDKLKREVSGYAKETKPGYGTDSELLAESYAYVWYNGKGQNPLADAVYDALMKRIGAL